MKTVLYGWPMKTAVRMVNENSPIWMVNENCCMDGQGKRVIWMVCENSAVWMDPENSDVWIVHEKCCMDAP